jgi:hypothetical protein
MMSLTVFAYEIKELTQFVLTENIFEKIKQKNKENESYIKRAYIDLWFWSQWPPTACQTTVILLW